MIQYLTGCTGPAVEAVLGNYDIGLLVQPGNRYDRLINRYRKWGGDNGVFTSKAGGFNPDKFRQMLDREDIAGNASTCAFIVAPDVLHVLSDGSVRGDAQATLDRFAPWAREIHSRGLPVALVAQDGLENMMDNIPWSDLEVLFIGGSTEWKLSSHAKECVIEARKRRKKTHMGRVNSYRRLSLANSWGVDTADGTFLKFGMSTNLPKVCAWIDKLRAEGSQT